MLIVDDILFSPVKSLLWIFKELHKRVEEEQENEGVAITQELSELYMMLETGRITDAEFDAKESDLLDRLDAFHERRSGHIDKEEDER